MKNLKLKKFNLKKLFFTVSIFVIFNISAFAKNGFEFILNVPLQMGIGMPPKILKDNDVRASGEIAFDGGITAQLGYMTQISSRFGVSLLAELGYSHDTLGMSMSLNTTTVGSNFDERLSSYTSFDSLQIGIIPKFNIGNFAIGIGGGIKIPMSGKIFVKALDIETSRRLNRGDIANIISPTILGYIKASLDYSIFFMDNLAFNIGLILGYDIFKDKSVDINGNKAYYGIFDMGVELGLKFGAKVD